MLLHPPVRGADPRIDGVAGELLYCHGLFEFGFV
jgi:hypothetical protein